MCRERAIQKFNAEDSQVFIFLLSIRAAGRQVSGAKHRHWLLCMLHSGSSTTPARAACGGLLACSVRTHHPASCPLCTLGLHYTLANNGFRPASHFQPCLPQPVYGIASWHAARCQTLSLTASPTHLQGPDWACCSLMNHFC